MSITRKFIAMTCLAVVGGLTLTGADADASLILDDFDNGVVANTDDGQNDFWSASNDGNAVFTEASSILTFTGSGARRPRNTLNTPLSTDYNFLASAITLSIDGLAFRLTDTMGDANIGNATLRLGFRETASGNTRGADDGFILAISQSGRVRIGWKVDAGGVDTEGTNSQLDTTLDGVNGLITGADFTVDGTGDQISWALVVRQGATETIFSDQLDLTDSNALRTGWGETNLGVTEDTAITLELQTFLGDDFAGDSVEADIDSFSATASTVPEPGSMSLAAVGLLMIVSRRRRTRSPGLN